MKLGHDGGSPFVSKYLKRLAMGSSSLVAAALLATAANAQGTSGGIETVTVTAQFTEQNIQATPLAISVVTADDLDQRGVSNLSGLSATVPSLTLNPAPAAFGNGLQAYMRGVGAYDTAYEHEPGVGMYIDDLYFGTLSGSELDLMDLSRVEILRGPQGVLGGKNDLGGSIKLFSQAPTDDNSGYLQATYGSRNEIYLKGAVNLTVIPDHLFMRVSAMSKHQDGYVNVIDYACKYPATAGTLPVLASNPNCKLGTQGGTNVSGGRIALRAVFNSHIEDTVSADIVRDDSEVAPDTLYAVYNDATPTAGHPLGVVHFNNGGGVQSVDARNFFGSTAAATAASPGLVAGVFNSPFIGNVARYGIPWDQRFIPADPYKTTYATYTSANGGRYTGGNMLHSWSLSNIFDWDVLPDWNVHMKVITGYRQYYSSYSDDSDVSPMSFQLTTTYNNNREFQQEERFTGTLFDKHLEWTAGVFSYDRWSHSTGPVILDVFYPFIVPGLVFEQNDTYKTNHNSGYVHLIYHIFDNLEVFGGWRYTSESKTYHFNHIGKVPGYPLGGFFRDTVNPACVYVISSSCPANAPLVDHISKTSRPDWRAGVDYHITDDKMVYFQYSTGYRTGGTNSRPFSPLQLNSYGPETIQSYEIGAKTDWFDHRLRVNLALYDAEYSNTIVPIATTDSSGAPWVKNVNLGSSTNKGVELEVTANPIDDLLISGNFSYIDATANPAPGAPAGFVDPLGTIPVGSPPILFPEKQFNLSAQYTFHLGGQAGDLTPRLDYNWQDVIHEAALGTSYLSLPSRGILNGRLAWDAPTGGWQLALSASNLTDEKYFYDMFNLAAFGFGTVTGNPAPGREWMLTLRKNF